MTDRERMWRTWYQQKLEFRLPPYKGVAVVKNPCDLWAYRHIIDATRPDHIVETGTFMGGSAVWLADQFEGHVTSIDVDTERVLPDHDRVSFIRGVSSTDPAVISHLRRHLDGRVMVILDSDHSKQHVLDELAVYPQFVTAGCFLIVEDTNPFAYQGPAGPDRALRAWQPTNHGFQVDRDIEPYMTCHPGGYLRRLR